VDAAAAALALLALAAASRSPAAPLPMTMGPLLAVTGLERTGAAFRSALVALAGRLGVDPNHLASAMSFETAGTFDPAKRNPRSGATGLIQFTPATARGLGTTLEALAAMTDVEQLAYVEKYFRSVARGGVWMPVDRLEDVYLAIFAPARMGQPLGAAVYTSPSLNYEQNRELDTDHDGTITVAEATAPVRAIYNAAVARGSLPAPSTPQPPGGPVPGLSLRQAEVTDEMTVWALDVLHGPLPIGATTGPRRFTGKDGGVPVDVIARVEQHPASSAVPHPHRGVGLYHAPGVLPAGGGKPTVPASTADAYRSQRLVLPAVGFVALPSGVEITRVPLEDENGLYARVGAATGAELLAAMGLRLPTAAEYLALHALSSTLHIEPVTLPTSAMLEADGVPKPWQDGQGNDTPQMASYRAAHMSTRAWCEQHDATVNAHLAAAGWSTQPVDNIGKHWCADGAILGWWLKGGGQIQGLSYFHEPGAKPHVPPQGMHTDYATTIHAVRGVVA
jgi:hypothetical protein